MGAKTLIILGICAAIVGCSGEQRRQQITEGQRRDGKKQTVNAWKTSMSDKNQQCLNLQETFKEVFSQKTQEMRYYTHDLRILNSQKDVFSPSALYPRTVTALFLEINVHPLRYEANVAEKLAHQFDYQVAKQEGCATVVLVRAVGDKLKSITYDIIDFQPRSLTLRLSGANADLDDFEGGDTIVFTSRGYSVLDIEEFYSYSAPLDCKQQGLLAPVVAKETLRLEWDFGSNDVNLTPYFGSLLATSATETLSRDFVQAAKKTDAPYVKVSSDSYQMTIHAINNGGVKNVCSR